MSKGKPLREPQNQVNVSKLKSEEKTQSNVAKLSDKKIQLAEHQVLSKPKKEKRKNFPLRLSKSERAALEEKAKAAGLKLSSYLRQAGLNKTISTKQERVPEINRFTYVELGRVGNNINQLTKAAHKSLQRGTDCNVNFGELSALLALLKQIRLEVMAVDQQQSSDDR